MGTTAFSGKIYEKPHYQGFEGRVTPQKNAVDGLWVLACTIETKSSDRRHQARPSIALFLLGFGGQARDFCSGKAGDRKEQEKTERTMSTAARRRLMRDFRKLQNDPPSGVSGAPMDNNIMLWQAVIFG